MEESGCTKCKFLLEDPVGKFPLVDCDQHSREIKQFVAIADGGDDITSLEFVNNVELGKCLRCERNDILIAPAQMESFKLSVGFEGEDDLVYNGLKKFLENLNRQDSMFYRRIRNSVDRSNDLTLANLYKAASLSYDQNPAISKLHASVEESTESKSGQKDEEEEEATGILLKLIKDLTSEEYLQLAASHLFYWFSGSLFEEEEEGEEEGGEQRRNRQSTSSLLIRIYGQRAWWIMHLSCPELDLKYRTEIATRIRSEEPRASAFRFENGEDFALDFWQAWVVSFRTFKNGCIEYCDDKFGKVGSDSSVESSKKHLKSDGKLDHHDASVIERSFRGSIATLILDSLSESDGGIDKKWKNLARIDPLYIHMIKCARAIQCVRERQRESGKKSAENE